MSKLRSLLKTNYRKMRQLSNNICEFYLLKYTIQFFDTISDTIILKSRGTL